MKCITRYIGGALAAGGLLAAPLSFALDVNLVAKAITKTLGTQAGTQDVTMWVLSDEAAADCNSATAPWAGPPTLVVPDTDSVLNITLLNCLPEPVSLVIPALPKALAPVLVNGRVKSMDAETTAGGTQTYSWSNVRPGTFLLHSGTMPGKQVPMGLYAAVTRASAAGEAYPGAAYDAEVVLLYSEIDPALNAAVAGGTYGTVLYPTSIDYQPRYFLVNGAVGPTTEAAAAANGTTLVRMLNAGLRNLVPTINGLHWDLLAEDGHPYPYAKTQYSVRLPAGGSADAVFIAGAAGDYPVYDRRLSLTADRNLAGGMLSTLTVGAPGADAPIAIDDSYSVDEDMSLVVDGTTLQGVLANDTDAGGTLLNVPPASASLASSPAAGSVSLNADGTFTYTPNADFNGTETFTYRANDGALNSDPATVTITVAPLADAPLVADDAYATQTDTQLVVTAPGVLGNDTDVDGDGITVASVNDDTAKVDVAAATTLGGSVTLSTDGSFTYDPPTGINGDDTFTYTAAGVGDASAAATVTITVAAPVEPQNQPPVANDDFALTSKGVPISIPVLDNDTDDGDAIDATSVAIGEQPNRGGTLVVNADGVITYTPKKNFRGTELFTYTVDDDDGATSNPATVTVNVVK